MLVEAKTPEQSKEVEAFASAAKAWAKEQGNYEMLVNSMHLWIMARRKTTELIKPNIQQGGSGSNQYGSKVDNDVKLVDFGFSYKQWNRRCKELEISEDEIANARKNLPNIPLDDKRPELDERSQIIKPLDMGKFQDEMLKILVNTLWKKFILPILKPMPLVGSLMPDELVKLSSSTKKMQKNIEDQGVSTPD